MPTLKSPFLAFYKKMPRHQKASLLAFAFMVFAIPFSVTASLNQIRIRSQAAAPISTPIIPTLTEKSINIPVFTTNTLPIGYLNISYQVLLNGYNIDPNTSLNLSVTGLPPGLSLTNCDQSADEAINHITCYISGRPEKSGDYPLTFTLSDAFSVSVIKKLNLKIESQKFKLAPINWIYQQLN